MAKGIKHFAIGNRVRYTAKFLQSVGGATGWPSSGEVVGHSTENPSWVRVQWKEREDSILVNACNLILSGKPDYSGL